MLERALTESAESAHLDDAGRKCPAFDFDHHTIDGGRRFEVLTNLLQRAPVFWSECHGGFWTVTAFEDVAAVLTDPMTFSSAKTEDGAAGQAIPPFMWQRNVPAEYDGHEHLRFRKLLAPALAPREIEGRRTAIASMVDNVFGSLESRAEVNAVSDIAVPVPTRSILDLMGLPDADADWFGLAVHEIMSTPSGTARAAELKCTLAQINQRILDEARARRRQPRDDLISRLANTEDAKGRLSETELLSMLVVGVLFGGMATSAVVLTNAMIYLDSHRDVRRQLIADPNLIVNFVQDIVRLLSPAIAVARTVTTPTTLAGQALRPGDRILAMLGCANLDERIFEHPLRVDPTAWRSRHVAFGLGTHFCPGATLARLEIELAIRALLRRAPNYEVAERGHIGRLAAIEGGWRSVPLRLHGSL